MPKTCELCKVALLGTSVTLEDPFTKSKKLYHYQCFVSLALKKPEEATCKIIHIEERK